MIGINNKRLCPQTLRFVGLKSGPRTLRLQAMVVYLVAFGDKQPRPIFSHHSHIPHHDGMDQRDIHLVINKPCGYET